MRVFEKERPCLLWGEKCTKEHEVPKKNRCILRIFSVRIQLEILSWAVQALKVLVNLMVGWMFTLVSFSLPRTILIFGRENEEQHWLQTCSGRGTEWGRSFDIPWNGTIYSHHQLHLSTTFPAFPRLLKDLCTFCGHCVRSRGSLAMKASYKAQSKLQKIIL